MNTVTIGNFDGIHLGHMSVIHRAISHGGRTTLICFEPVSRQFFSEKPWKRRLTTAAERLKILRGLDLDRIWIIPFDDVTADRSANDFLDSVVKECSPSRIVVGWDFHFGRSRCGNAEFLRRWCTSREIHTIIVPPLKLEDATVKSEVIRCHIENGEMASARKLLGRPYSVTGAVARGKGLGRELGFPTVNLRVPDCKLLPGTGSYGGSVELDDGRRFTAAVFIPSGSCGPVEAHVPGTSLGNLYGSGATVALEEKIRDAAPSPGPGELRELIAGDVREVLKRADRKSRMEETGR